MAPALILALESSTTVCSVALSSGAEIVAHREINDGYRHASMLTQFIGEVLDEAGIDAGQLSAVAVSKGPGSYTGLRIGVSAAKGICFAVKTPLIGVSALEAMALEASAQCNPGDILIPMIDARRMEVYMSVYTAGMVQLEPVVAKVISAGSFDHIHPAGSLILIGDGAVKFREMFAHRPEVKVREDILPMARLLVPPALAALEQKRFEDLAYFEPLYVKDFIAGKPRVKGLF